MRDHVSGPPPSRDVCIEDPLADLEPADLAPSIDQLDRAMRLLRERAHPLSTGDLILGYALTYSPRTCIAWLRVEVMEAADEIYASPATRCFALHPDGRVEASTRR